MINFVNFIFSQRYVKIAKLSHVFSYQFETVLFCNFRKFEILLATNFCHSDENVLLREDSAVKLMHLAIKFIIKKLFIKVYCNLDVLLNLTE